MSTATSTTVRDAIAAFLNNRTDDSSFLIPRWSPALETQVMVRPGDDSQVTAWADKDGEPAAWSDGEQRWCNHRWPKFAATKPTYRDKPLTYSPGEHVSAIGSTWWDWESRQSVAVAFDFDATQGHAGGNSPEQLEAVLEAARSLPYTTIVRSKSGEGFHVYIFFGDVDRPQSENHNEHAAVAKAVLHKMQTDTGFPFADYVDCYGGNFWIWHSEAKPHGFELVQAAVESLTADDVPPIPKAVQREYESVKADGTHEQVLQWMRANRFPVHSKTQGDRTRYDVHTCGLAAAHKALGLRGEFETVSQGSNLTTPNAYMFPADDGAFHVFRFGSANEPTWEKRSADGRSWCWLNRLPVIRIDANTPRMVAETIAAMATGDVYQNSEGILTQVNYNPDPDPFLIRNGGKDNLAPRIAPYKRTVMYEVLPKVARYEALGPFGFWEHAIPPDALRAAIFDRGEYPGVKVLRAVVNRPIILPDGQIWSQPGYHADSGFYLHDVGEYPEPMTNGEALAWFDDILHDFPFVMPAHKSVWLSGLLTLLARHLIKGNAPVHSVEGNRSRVGKGLVSDLWILIHLGRRASRYSLGNDTELKKFLTSIAMSGQQYVIFDNLKTRFGGAALEAALTTGRIADRVLGLSKDVDLPLNVFWAATANGPCFTDDMRGRIWPIVLETDNPNPETRTGFRHENLIDYVLENRPQLVMAGLSILRNYIKAGKPLPDDFERFGGFEPWSELVHGAILYASQEWEIRDKAYPQFGECSESGCWGWADPLEAHKEFSANFEGETNGELQQLMAAWEFTEPTSVKDAVAAATAEGSPLFRMRELLDPANRPDKTDTRTPSLYLGRLLQSARGRDIGGKAFDRTSRKNNPQWFVKGVQ